MLRRNELMNKVLRDMPEEPMVYLLRTMYKKSGMEIPQGIRYGGLRKSTSELSRSPERLSRSAQVSRSTDAAAVSGSRDYNRPWATSPTRRVKVRKSEDFSSGGQRPDWNPDTKAKTTSFDALWETGAAEQSASHKDRPTMASRKSSPTKHLATSSSSAWAAMGVLEADEVYTSPAVSHNASFSRGQTGTGSCWGGARMSEEELLAQENIRPSLRTAGGQRGEEVMAATPSKQRVFAPRHDARRHQQEMAHALREVDGNTPAGGPTQVGHAMDDPDAIELLEDAEDLRREGVTNVSPSGYKLSKAMRHRQNEPRVKLSLNAYPYPAERSSRYDWDNTSLQSSPEQCLSDEEFESVSQVSGPRQPVWRVPDTDREFPEPRGAPYSRQQQPLTSSSTSAPPRHQHHHQQPFMESTLPSRGSTPGHVNPRTVSHTADLVHTAAQPWTDAPTQAHTQQSAGNKVSFQDLPESRPESSRSLRSETDSGGWLVPEDTEVASALDWNQRVKGGRRQDPRSY